MAGEAKILTTSKFRVASLPDRVDPPIIGNINGSSGDVSGGSVSYTDRFANMTFIATINIASTINRKRRDIR